MPRFRLPVWLKAIVSGFVILEVLTRIWPLVALANLRTSPGLPWSSPLMLVLLWFAWEYLRGSGPPASSKETRRQWSRANRPRGGSWAWISAALLGGVILQLIIIGTRLVSFESGPVRLVEQINVYPPATVVLLILMTSLVAGVSEELAFRGYMQKPMEMAYGPWIAITAVAIFFTLLHLPNASIAPHLIPLFFVGALGWGVLAYLTNSIVPGVVAHTLVDVVGLMWTWRNFDHAKAMAAESVARDGIDLSFAILVATTLISVAALIGSFYALGKSHPPKAALAR